MAINSSIEWTESTWNPVTGCTKISAGCENCYAERMAKRLKAMGNPNYKNGFHVTLHPESLKIPLNWKSPQIIFVNSMSDLFHKDVPLNFIQDIFSIMKQADWHQFQILTKRAERLAEISEQLEWADNVWMGVSVENNDYIHRVDYLRRTGAKIKFISFEPLIGPIIDCDYKDINWIIVGGESGPRSRPVKESWIKDIRDNCLKGGIPFFFKQWGGFNKKKAGRKLEGKYWNQMPIFEMMS